MRLLFFKAVVLAISGLGIAFAAQDLAESGPEIVARQTIVMTALAKHVPSGTVVDGPILGNGDLGIAIAGSPEEQTFYFGKNDFWSQQASPMSVGGLILSIPALAGATYRQEQDLANAEVRGRFTKGGTTVKMRTWAAATENLAVTELSVAGPASISATAKLFPDGTTLKDNDKHIDIGREQSGVGRWYFNGLIDEVHLFSRALPQNEIQQLVDLREPREGLLRRWDFEEDEGKTPQDAPAKLMLGPSCGIPPAVYRPDERPTNEPLGCIPEGYHLDYQRYSLGKHGRSVKLTHSWDYLDAGVAPPLQAVTVAAWIYIYSAGDANFILSKGAWNDAYSLALDHGRLRFNIGERFVRSKDSLPSHRWVHVAGTFDGHALRAYIDGTEVLPRARFLYGGEEAGAIWLTRNADGPLDDQYPWPNPIAPTSSVTTKGREVSLASCLLGAASVAHAGAITFQVRPGEIVYLVTSVLSDLDAPAHLAAAQARIAALNPKEIVVVQAAHRKWWRHFWSESSIQIGDPELEKYYYSSQYVIASASRTGKVAPGLYGNWVTTDHPSWNGDYTLNYNHQTPFLGLYSSNHIAATDSYDPPILAFMERAKTYARTLLNIRGVYYPGHIGPWGLERPFDYDPFMGQKGNAVFLVQPMLMRFYSTYDRRYTEKVYPFILEVGNFWEDYLKFENGRYVIHDDCAGEVGPWLLHPDWATCPGNFNPMNDLGFLRATFKGLIDMSAELMVDADRREKWQYILDHLSAYPTTRHQGATVFRSAENGPGRIAGWGTLTIWPAGQIGLGSDPKLLQTARNTIAWRGYSNHPLVAPAMARVGADPNTILSDLRKLCLENAYPNGYIFFAGGGVETASTVPATINEMLLQSHEGILRLFPVWPKNKNAQFDTLRAYGAFLVSSNFANGRVTAFTIKSEKGKDCALQNPWPGKSVVIYRNGQKAEVMGGAILKIKTSLEETISATDPGN